MRRRFRIPFIILSSVATVVVIFFSFTHNDTDIPGYERVRVRSVMFGRLLETAELDGTRITLARQGQEVSPGQILACVDTGAGIAVAARSPVKGRIAGVSVSPGDGVGAGTELFVIRRMLGD